MMIWKLLWFFIGYVKFRIDVSEYEKAVIALFSADVRPLSESKRKDRACFDLRKKDVSTAREAFINAGIGAPDERERGLLHVLSKYKKRPGVAVGSLLVLVSVIVSGRFLWSIEIVGLERVDELRALEILEKHGVYVGCYYPSLELRKLYNEILLDCDEFSWISVNIRGTHATVEVRETQPKKKMTPINGKCANLVSAYDAQITAVRTYAGESVIKVGDSIKEGELLISGLYEDKMGRLVCTYAQGEVEARIRVDLSSAVPLQYDKKMYTGEKSEKVSLKIFNKVINILNYSRNYDSNYDIIKDDERLRLLGRYDLPVLISKESAVEYYVETRTRDEQTAKSIAYADVGRRILSCAGEGEILSVEYDGYVEDGAYVLCAHVCINTDVTRVQEFVYNEG